MRIDNSKYAIEVWSKIPAENQLPVPRADPGNPIINHQQKSVQNNATIQDAKFTEITPKKPLTSIDIYI